MGECLTGYQTQTTPLILVSWKGSLLDENIRSIREKFIDSLVFDHDSVFFCFCIFVRDKGTVRLLSNTGFIIKMEKIHTIVAFR